MIKVSVTDASGRIWSAAPSRGLDEYYANCEEYSMLFDAFLTPGGGLYVSPVKLLYDKKKDRSYQGRRYMYKMISASMEIAFALKAAGALSVNPERSKTLLG